MDSIVKFIFKLPYMDCKLHIIHYFDPKKTNANIFLSGAYLDQCFCPVNFQIIHNCCEVMEYAVFDP